MVEEENIPECKMCGSRKNLVEHHIDYEKGTTITLCRSCHSKVHNNPKHKYYPEDYNPSFSIRIPRRVNDELERLIEKGIFTSKSEAVRTILRERLLAF